MSGAIEPRGRQEAFLPSEVVRENVRTAIAHQPDLVSFDVTSEEGELLALKCAVDPGVPATQRDGWKGTVVNWSVNAYEVTDEKTGEVITLPSLALISDSGELVRLTGAPAIKAWAVILRTLGAERVSLGLKIVCKRRPSGTAGRSYWTVLPDC